MATQTSHETQVRPSNASTVAAFVIGLVAIAAVVLPGLRMIAVVPALIALVLGIWARAQVRDGVADREDFAVLGYIFGLVVSVHWALGIVSLIAG